VLSAIRPNRFLVATFAIPALIVPVAGYLSMRSHYSFMEASVGSRHFSEIGAWVLAAVCASLLYAAPASLVFLMSRRHTPKYRNSLLLLTLLAYLAALGVWIAVQRA
jgi:ABC-type xylose transport system permease subunit